MAKIVSTTKTLILNDKNELLILKIGEHTKQPDRSYTQDLPGGFVDNGEDERVGAVREVKEETNIDIDTQELILIMGETDFHPEHETSVTHLIYMVKLDYTPEVTISWEHESFQWVPFSQAATKFADRPRYKRAVEHLALHGLV